MANDLAFEARQALIVHMRGDAALTALVDAECIYGEQPPAAPAWPFVRYGISTVVPDRASGLDGSRITVSISSFAKGPGTDAVSAIGKQVAKTVEVDTIETEAGDLLNIFWAGSLLVRDPEEADGWQHINTFEIEIAAD